MPEFTLKNTRYCLLTYSQTDPNFQHDAILNVATLNKAECLIARELHGDGGTHYHALLHWERPFTTRSTRIFDVCGHHPNILRVGKTPWVAFDYCIKDGDIVAGGLERPAEEEETTTGQHKSDWDFICDAPDRETFFERLRSGAPRQLVCSFPSITKYADWKYRRDTLEYRHPEDFTFNLDSHPDLRDWTDDNLRGGITGR